MRKRISRPQRFVALDNGSMKMKSIVAKGLLATLIYAKDGDEVTVDGLCKTHIEGRELLTKAMRYLVEDAFVVKFKIQRATTEVVTAEDGSKETKRGGSWWTTFTVDSIPFTAEDVLDMLVDIYAGENVKAVRVEPQRFDPGKNPAMGKALKHARPTYGIPSVGPTCGNTESSGAAEAENPENSGPRPTYGKPTVGRPTVGPSAAHIRKKTSSSLSADAEAAKGGPTDGEREEDHRPQQTNDTAAPAADSLPTTGTDGPVYDECRTAGARFEHPAPGDTGPTGDPAAEASPTDAEQVLAAYEEALGGRALNGTRTRLLADACELLDARPLWWVIARARELPKYGTDLGKHAAMSTVPFAKKPPARPAGLPQEDPGYKPVQRDMSELRSILDAMRQPSI